MASWNEMKKQSAKTSELSRKEILAGCERTRHACNKLSDEERRQLREKALAVINGHDAKKPARSR